MREGVWSMYVPLVRRRQSGGSRQRRLDSHSAAAQCKSTLDLDVHAGVMRREYVLIEEG